MIVPQPVTDNFDDGLERGFDVGRVGELIGDLSQEIGAEFEQEVPAGEVVVGGRQRRQPQGRRDCAGERIADGQTQQGQQDTGQTEDEEKGERFATLGEEE